MGTTHEASIRVRSNRFFDIGIVGRRTGITVKPNVKKDADGLDNIDDFWDDGDNSSLAPAPLKGQSQRQANNQSLVEAQELELSRRQHPPRISEYIDPELVDEALHDIPEELLLTPASRGSRSEFNSTATNPVYTSASDRPQAQESRMVSSAIHESSREEYLSPPFQAIKRRIDFTQNLSEAEPEFEGTPMMDFRVASNTGHRRRIGMDSPEGSSSRDLDQRTPNTLRTSTTPLEAYRPTLSQNKIISPSRIGGTTTSHARYTGPSKAFDFELADSGSVSGPDDIVDEEDQEDDDSLHLPETPSRASHSILVSATPLHLRGPAKTAPSLKSRVASAEALLDEEDYHKVPPVTAAYQFSDEEGVQDYGYEDTALASRRKEDQITVQLDRVTLEEASGASVRERKPTDSSEDNGPLKRRRIRPRRAVNAKKLASSIPDQASRDPSTRPNRPRRSRTDDVRAVTIHSAETSGREPRKRKEPPQESTALTLVPLERQRKFVEQDDSGVRRSNRITFKPLEFWRNERVILGRSDNTPQPVPVIKGVVRAPHPEPAAGRGIKRARGDTQPSATKSRTKSATRYPKIRTQHADDGAEADEENEEDEDHSSDPEGLRQQGFTQGGNQQFECVDQATGSIVVRALAESKDAMQFQDVPGGHYQYHRGLEDEDTISSGIVRIPGQGTKPNKNASASSVVRLH
ncbi:hypothetical protein EC968_002397 [Mortierella alpina]|nr:hypothetical protein EC968_002397 [Mortierella alpina]